MSVNDIELLVGGKLNTPVFTKSLDLYHVIEYNRYAMLKHKAIAEEWDFDVSEEWDFEMYEAIVPCGIFSLIVYGNEEKAKTLLSSGKYNMELTDSVFGFSTVDDFPLASKEMCLWLQERYEDDALYMYLVTAWAMLGGYTGIKMYYAKDHINIAKRNNTQLPDDIQISIGLYNPRSEPWVFDFRFDKSFNFIIEPTGFKTMPCTMKTVDKLDRMHESL